MASYPHHQVPRDSTKPPRARLSGGVLLGIGLGGFLDGIVFHQILQWHNMASAILPPTTMPAMMRNMAWDGWFHFAMWIVTVAGVIRLWHDEGSRQTTAGPRLLGEALSGWGGFNLLEGLVDHHLLSLHHVRDLPVHVPAYDWLFLGFGGVGLLVMGAAVSRRTTQR